MKKKLALSALLTLIISVPQRSFAWGKTGHGIVAEIAFSFLDTNTKTAVRQYLGATTIEDASTWMDDMRSDHS
jgi:glycopeptide antibiotics resistance protein